MILQRKGSLYFFIFRRMTRQEKPAEFMASMLDAPLGLDELAKIEGIGGL
jgi:hypothetical protein